MGKSEENALVVAAQRDIAKILAKLEVDTGSVVESIDLRDIDVTSIDSEREEWQRAVIVELKRLPGTRWAA